MGLEVYYPADIRNALLAAEQAVNATADAAGNQDDPFTAGFLSGYRAALATLALEDMSAPEVSTSFTVTDYIYSASGKAVPIWAIQPGGIVIVTDFRAREATESENDYRTQWSSFQLVGVEVDLERMSARLIPAGDRNAFQQMLAQMAAYPQT